MILDRKQIAHLIPHRDPILLLDRVTACVPGVEGEGECDLREGAPQFAGHFPGNPILPGAFVVEACGQLLAVVCRLSLTANGGARGSAIDYLASIERFKFLRPIRPAEVLKIKVRVGREARGLLQSRVAAYVNREVAAEGVLSVTTPTLGETRLYDE